MGFPVMSMFPIPDGTYTVSSSITTEQNEILPAMDVEEYDRKFLKDCGIVTCKF